MADKGMRRRRQWIIQPRFQIPFALVLVLLQINVGIVFQGVLHFRVRQLAREAGSLREFLTTDLWSSTLPLMALAAVIVGTVVFVLGIRYSNQIVGPLPRVRRALNDLTEGKSPTRLKFRPGDVLEELASDINRLADSIDEQRGTEPAGQTPQVNSAEAAPVEEPVTL